MECPTCFQRTGEVVDLKISHRIEAGPGVRTSRGTCNTCKNTHTIVQFVANVVGDYGTGAHALAKRLRAGKVVPVLEPVHTS
jgi:transcriptional regulator NrdR family protein